MHYVFIDLMRVISAYGVVLLHTTSYALKDYNGAYFNEFIILNSFTSLAVPVFFLSSGAVILSKKYRFDNVYRRIKRILLPLVFWSLLFELHANFYGAHKGITDIITDILCDKVMYHLWFLYSLLGIMIISPLLLVMVHSMGKKEFEWICKITLLLFFINTFLMSLDYHLAYTFMTLPSSIVYFIAGYYLLKYDCQYDVKKLVGGSIACVIVIALLTIISSHSSGKLIQKFMDKDCFFVLIASGMIFVIGKRIENEIITRTRKILGILNSATFFCYIIHVFILDKLIGLYGYNMYNTRHPIFMSVIISILTFSVCMALGVILKRIRIIKNFI